MARNVTRGSSAAGSQIFRTDFRDITYRATRYFDRSPVRSVGYNNNTDRSVYTDAGARAGSTPNDTALQSREVSAVVG